MKNIFNYTFLNENFLVANGRETVGLENYY